MRAPVKAATVTELYALMREHPRGFWVPTLSDALYHKRPGVSRSDLLRMLKTPHHFRAHMDPAPDAPRKESSAAMEHGTLVHMLVLEPERFPDVYRVGPDVESRALKEWRQWAALHDGYHLITPTQHRRAFEQAAQVQAHPVMVAARAATCYPEPSLYWPDPSTGVWLKARPDLLVLRETPHGLSVELIDLKTTADASEQAFNNSVASYGYAAQTELYTWGVEEVLGVTPERFLFLASESEYPYACATYELSHQWRELAQRDICRALDLLKTCGDKDEWPSYPTEPVLLTPPYRLRKDLIT